MTRPHSPAPSPTIKAVLVTMFEPSDSRPGELSRFREHYRLQPVAVPGLDDGQVLTNGQGLLALVAGVGPVNTATSVLTLGLSDAFDLRQAGWLICGIAGINPHEATLGSAVWADWVVDGDLGFELDARDMPDDWETGILPLGARQPYGESPPAGGAFGHPYQVFQLERSLVDWASKLTAGIKLADNDALRQERERFTTGSTAHQAPGVMRGDNLSAARFWHGPRFNTWAERWVKHWTAGEGTFVTSGMEDTGTLHALRQLDRLGRASFSKALLLRTGSNFTMPPPGVDLMENLTGHDGEGEANYPGLEAALDSGLRCGRVVIDAMLAQ